MAYDIDFLPVGDGERSGDAIALRFGTIGQQKVVVIDGGTKESGEAVVAHVQGYYGTNTVDAAICTHSDADHASGLTEVLESLDVKRLYMHLPWKHVANIDDVFKDPRVSTNSLIQRFRKSLDSARALAALAEKNKIPIREPFSDFATANGPLIVLGPSIKYYEGLLATFRCAPEVAEKPLLATAIDALKEVIKNIAEDWNIETLGEPTDDACSAENNSSVILLFTDGNDRFLFTSDAGVPALKQAIECAQRIGIDLTKVDGIQVPHHGSKHNVSPSILDTLLGQKRAQQEFSKKAIVSASKGGEPKHPAKKVVNAFMRRGVRVYATQGIPLWYHSNDAPARSWGGATPLPFSMQVEE